MTWITLGFTYLLEVVTDLKLALLCGNVGLDFSVSVVNDGQEHVEQDEEYEEDICDEEDRAKNTIGGFQGVEVEITQDDTEQCKSERQEKNTTYHFRDHKKKTSKISKRDKCTASRVECYIKLCVHSRMVFCFSLNQLCAREPARVSWKCARELSFHAADATYMASSKVLKSRT